jgi:hypothetical protein
MTNSFAFQVLNRKITRPEKNVAKRIKKLTVKVGDVFYKMMQQLPERFFCFNVLLPANMTIPSKYDCSAVKAVFFFSFWLMRHAKFFLKIGTKKG